MSKKTDRHAFKQKVRALHDWYWSGLRRSKIQEEDTSIRFTREDLEYEVGLTRAEADVVYRYLIAAEKQGEYVQTGEHYWTYSVPGTGEEAFARVLKSARSRDLKAKLLR